MFASIVQPDSLTNRRSLSLLTADLGSKLEALAVSRAAQLPSHPSKGDASSTSRIRSAPVAARQHPVAAAPKASYRSPLRCSRLPR